MRIIRYCFMGLILLMGITFACLNPSWVDVDIYLKIYHLPLSLLIVLMLAIGFLMGFCLFQGRYLAVKRSNSALRSRLYVLEQEVANLRTIPLKND